MLSDRRTLTRGWFVCAAALVAVLVPVAAYYARLAVQQAGWYDTEVGLALVTLANVIALAVLVWWSDTRIQRSERLRQQADDSIRESEQRFRSLLEGVPHLVWTCRPDGPCDFLSRQWRDYTGRPQSDHLGSGWLDAIHTEDRARLVADWQRVVVTRAPFDNECRIRSATGEYRWFRAQAVWVAEGDGGKWIGTNSDIHDKKRAEEKVRDLTANLERRVAERTAALRESEERFQLALTAAAAIGFVWNVVSDSVVRYFSTVSSLSTNLDAPEPVAVVRTRVHPSDVGYFDAGVAECLRDGETQYRNLYRVVDPNGSHRWLQEWGTLTRDTEGRPLQLTGISIDVTARKQAEDALQESEKRYRLAVQATNDAVWDIDITSGAVHWSEQYASAFGRPPETANSWQWWIDRIHPDDRDRTASSLRAAMAGTVEAWASEYRLQLPNGEWADIRDRAYIARDPSGKAVRVVGAMQDVTAINQSAAERDRMWNLSLDPMCLAGFDGYFMQVNPAWVRTLGWTAEELTSRPWLDFVHVDDRQATVNIAGELIGGQMVYHFENRYQHRDGTYRWLSWNAYSAVEQQIIFCITRDVTEQKRAEAALRQSEEQLRAIIENEPECVKLLDRDGKLLEMNPAGLRMIEADDLEQVRGARVCSLLAPAEQCAFDQLVAATFRGEHGSMVFEMQGLKGTRRTLETRSVPMWDADHREVRALLGVTRDITEQKRAETALRESEERLRLALNAGRMGIFDWDIVTNAIVWSDTHYELFGYPAGERFPVEFRHFADRIHPDDLPAVERALRAAMETAAPYRNEARVLLPDGTTHWVMGAGEFQYASDGRPVRMLGTVSDITERKQAEEALLASEMRARAVINTSPVPMALNDDAQRITFLNLAFTRTFGYELADIPTLADWWPKAYPDPAYRQWVAEAWQAELTRSAQTGTAFAMMELTIRCKDGTDRFVEVNAASLADTFAGIHLVVLHDITVQRQAKADLLMRDRAIRAVNQGILITDPNLRDNPIVYVSPGYEKMTGYASAEVVGQNCRVLQGKDTDRAEVARFAMAVRSGMSHSGELLNYRKDGTTFWNELSITPVRDPDERLVHFVGIQTDVTARRSLEDQLRQAQKMEAVGQLAGGVAHDFNNLLTVINGYSEMLLTEMSSDHPQFDPLVGIREAGERAAALTHQLLAFSRRTIVAPRVLDVNELIASSTKMLRRLIGEDIPLATVFSPVPCHVRIDPSQLEQVVMNLVVNARDAMPKGGRITFETNAIDLLVPNPDCPAGRYIRLAVTDTGTGMTEEVKRRLFEPFFTTKGVGKGTGLGLAMVYGVVRQAGGSVQIDSTVGKGTTFTLLLPEVPIAAAERSADGLAIVIPRGTETILLVEDEDAVRAFSRRVMEMQGYTVVEAESGSVAIATATSHSDPIHLLVTDVVMPDLGGRDLTEEIRRRRPAIRVLYVSGYTSDAVLRHGVEEEKDSFLQKPFTPRSLARKIREVLDAPHSSHPETMPQERQIREPVQ